MTVGELITELQKFDRETQVKIMIRDEYSWDYPLSVNLDKDLNIEQGIVLIECE